ncbi:MAG: hypothetical protein PHS93_08295 [Candidatus Omnitrophica bacterium]|nr:hypothetical protein [Candidatus Omnitrophota bacterium]MDD5589132.1 hypothetical protein [Candidatus Nanoarchaeia archaeon]
MDQEQGRYIEDLDLDFISKIANIKYDWDLSRDTILSDNTPDAKDVPLNQNELTITIPFDSYVEKYKPDDLILTLSEASYEMVGEMLINYLDKEIEKLCNGIDSVDEEIDVNIRKEPNNDISILISWRSIA